MNAFSWQQLGAFVSSLESLGEDHLWRFSQMGGRYLLPVLVGDATQAERNLSLIEFYGQLCRRFGVHLGCWVNCFGQDPHSIVTEAEPIILRNNLAPVVLDAEAPYQGNTKMSDLTLAFRTVFPVGTRALAVTTNSLNDSVVYNGRRSDSWQPGDKSFRHLSVHVLPQWYSSPNYEGCWTEPVCNMRWLMQNGMLDNFHDPGYDDHRGLALAQVHGVVEPTGVEGAQLKPSLDAMLQAQSYGYAKGVCLYLLERTTDDDLALVRKYKGALYL